MKDIITISSQLDTIEEIVSEKIAEQDFTVQVSPVFEIDGQKYRVILDGHHSLEAAHMEGVEPEFEEIRHDAQGYLDCGDIDGFLEAVYIDCQYYDIETGKPAF